MKTKILALRVIAISLLTFIAGFTVIMCVFTITSAFSQADTIPVPKKDSQVVELIKLNRINSEKTVEYDAVKDTAARSLEDLSKLNVKADNIKQTLKSASDNLKKATAEKERDVQRIDKVYRIDTSPRPIVINVTNPYPLPVKRNRR